MKTDARFTLLTSFGDMQLAYLFQSFLGNEGIYSWLKDEMTITVNPFYSSALGGYKIMVTSEQYERANELLKEFLENLDNDIEETE